MRMLASYIVGISIALAIAYPTVELVKQLFASAISNFQ